jgi:hypothetical protein
VERVRVVVIYESVMGNTRRIAEAIAAGASARAPQADVQCVPVGWATDDALDADLLVVGAPTHYFGLPAERSRRHWVKGALKRAREGALSQHLEPGAAGPGLREWLADLPPTRPGLLAATFDTRLPRPLAGSAARVIARALREHGMSLVAAPSGFLVEDVAGPLRDGEVARAMAWGDHIATSLSVATTRPSP